MAKKTKPDGHQAERLRRQRSTLADFGLRAFRADDLDALLHEAAVHVSHAIEVDLVKVLELQPDGKTMLLRAGVNWKPGIVGHATLGAGKHSPGGYALHQDKPVVSRDVATENRFEIPPLLLDHGVKSMINVLIPGETAPFGVLEVDARECRDFDEDDVAFLRNYANLLAGAIERVRAHAVLARTVEERKVLVYELQHRVKNLMALVQSLAVQTSTRPGVTAKAYREAFLGRLQALARAQALLFEDHGQETDLAALVEREVEPHRGDRPAAVAVEGEPVTLTGRHGLTLGLVFHELATNAAKYGALSTPEGRVRVSWRVEDEGRVRLLWQEQGGPAVEPPPHKGFGTGMIARASAYELGGGAELVYAPEGLRCEITFPLKSKD